MKKPIVVLIFLIMITQVSNAQGMRHFQQNGKGMNRLAEVEKIKLLETLDLDEETAAVFIVRLNKYKEMQQSITEKRQNALSELAGMVKDSENSGSDYNAKVNEIIKYEEELLAGRKEFIKSLADIMDEKKISKFVVFEYLFRQEIRNELRKRRGHGK